MTKKISHYVAKYNMPGYAKGYRVERNCFFGYPCERFPDIFEPVYENDPVPPSRTICEELKRFCGINTDMVPDGILAFRHPDCADEFKTGTDPKYYKEWYWKCKSFPGTYISKIKVDGVEWSVGEIVKDKYNESTYRISSFKWMADGHNYWMFGYDDTHYSMAISTVCKLTRKPIVTLQGKDMYEGDKYWYVDKNNFYMESFVMLDRWLSHPHREYFSTKELAEQYIRNNRPVYPAGLVEEVLTAFAFNQEYSPLLDSAIDKLKAFKFKP